MEERELMATENENEIMETESVCSNSGNGALWMLAGAVLSAGIYAGVKAVRKAVQKIREPEEDYVPETDFEEEPEIDFEEEPEN